LAAGTAPLFAHRDLWARAAGEWRPGVSEVCWIKAHLEWEEAEAPGFPGMLGRGTGVRTPWPVLGRPATWSLRWRRIG
jgi:hypothetical protein